MEVLLFMAQRSCEIGDKFGKLTIQKTWSERCHPTRKEKICECFCECGKTITIKASYLRHQDKKSCGCEEGRGNRDRCQVGEKYGMLTVIKSWSEKFEHHKSKEKVCECRCDCGKVITVRARYFRKGHKSSCGCLRNAANSQHHAWKGHGEISMTQWGVIFKGSKRRGRKLEFDITIEQGWDLFLAQNRKCAISGVDIQFSYRNIKYKPEENTASLDRIDSSKGYTIDNIQWVHKEVNIMKMAMSQELFLKWCATIAIFQEHKSLSI